MRRMMYIASLLLFLIASRSEAHPKEVTRVGIADFQNLTQNKSLDWLTTEVAEEIWQDLVEFPEFKLFDRRYQGPTPINVQTIISGSIEPHENGIRIEARAIDSINRTVLAEVSVDGTDDDVRFLCRTLTEKLATAMKLPVPPSSSNRAIKDSPAFRAFSRGRYYLRNGLFNDALPQFDEALALQTGYADAQFYKGITLEKLNRWDDAIVAFKRALPDAAPERRLRWSWKAPNSASSTRIIVGLDFSELSLQGDVLRADREAALHKQFIYADRAGKNTILNFVDPERRTTKRLELADEHIAFDRPVVANDRVAVVTSAEVRPFDRFPSIRLYGIGRQDGQVRWQSPVKAYNTQMPLIGLAPQSVYVYFRENTALNVFDDQSGITRWFRQDFAIDVFEPPKTRTTKTFGNVMILKTAKIVAAVRLVDGADAWTFKPRTTPFTHIVTEHAVIVFEPDHRISILDVETGKPVAEVAVPQFTDHARLGPFGFSDLAGAIVQSDTLYFLSKKLELYAVRLNGAVRWHTPFGKKINTLFADAGSNRVFVGTQTGELSAFDLSSGSLAYTVTLGSKSVVVHHAEGATVVVSSEKSLYGLDASNGSKRWEQMITTAPKQVRYFKGIVFAATSQTQLSAIDVHTGDILWQSAAKHAPMPLPIGEALFLIDDSGIQEYALVERNPTLRESEVWAELANALLGKGNVEEAEAILHKVAATMGPDSPTLHEVRARLEKAKGNARAAATELAILAAMVGDDSPAGKDAMAELQKSHGVLWRERLDIDPIGDPVLVSDRLLSIGRSAGGKHQTISLTSSGHRMWSQPVDRFSDLVVDPATGRAWQVTSSSTDPSTVLLYALDLGTSERKELAHWSHGPAVSLAAIAYNAEHLFVATIAPDRSNGKMSVAIDCVKTDGTKLWDRVDDLAADLPEMQLPLGVFLPHGEYLVYSIGSDLWILSGADGTVVQHRHENAVIAPQLMRTASSSSESDIIYYIAGNELVEYHAARGIVISRMPLPGSISTFLIDGSMLYATDGNCLFGFDVNAASETWRIEGRFLRTVEDHTLVRALREDGTLLDIDRATGRVLAEHFLPWLPSGFSISGNTLYAFTADGSAFALAL